MKLIFLDIDGVLISERFMSDNTADPRCVEQLNRITDRTGADIVVSSSWRHHGIQKVTLILRQWGVTGNILDITPDMRQLSPDKKRRCEILKWMDSYEGYSWLNDAYVIIDDEPDVYASRHTVLTDPAFGLNEVDADKAIAILEEYKP